MSDHVWLFEMPGMRYRIGKVPGNVFGSPFEVTDPRNILLSQDKNQPNHTMIQCVPLLSGPHRIMLYPTALIGRTYQDDFDPEILRVYMESITGLVLPTGNSTSPNVVKFSK